MKFLSHSRKIDVRERDLSDNENKEEETLKLKKSFCKENFSLFCNFLFSIISFLSAIEEFIYSVVLTFPHLSSKNFSIKNKQNDTPSTVKNGEF